MIVVTPALPPRHALPLEMQEALNSVSPTPPIPSSIVHVSSNRSHSRQCTRSTVTVAPRRLTEQNIARRVSLATRGVQGFRRRNDTTLVHVRRARISPLIWVEASRTGRLLG